MPRPSRLRAYGQNLPLIDVFPFPVFMSRSPTVTDRDFEVGQAWVYNSSPTTRQIYFFGGLNSSQEAIWIVGGPGSSDLDQLGADAGDDPVSPQGGKIDLLGTADQIITTGDDGAASITFSLADATELVTSLEVPLIIGGSAGSLNLKLGDAAGATAVNILDSADVTVASINSDGNFSFNNLTVVNLTATGTTQILGNNAAASSVTIASGVGGNTVSINNAANTGANTVNISAGAAGAASTVNILSGAATTGVLALNLNTGVGTPTSRTTNIGTGAAVVNAINIGGTGANVIAIGNTQTAGSVAIGDAMTTGTIAIGGSGLQTGTITISASTAAQTIAIANTDGTKTIGIGNGVDGNAITIGNGINTTAQTVSIANGASAANSTVNILSGIGTVGAGVLALGNNTRVTTIGLGNIAPAAARTITISGGNSAQNDTLDILAGAPSAGTQTVNILTGTSSGGTQALNLGALATVVSVKGVVSVNASTNANVNIATGTSTGVVAIGNSLAGAITLDTAAGVSIDAATASNFTVTGAGADLTLSSVGGSVKIDSTESAAGAIALTANGGVAETITIVASQGTGAGSVALTSTAGGITLTGGLATADAINIVASNAAGGIDVDAGTGGMSFVAANGAIDITSGTGAITIGTDATQHNVTIGSTTGTSAITLQSGSGNVGVTGNLILNSVATQIRMNGGAATDFIGTGTLNNGTVTVANTNIATADQIYIQRIGINGSTALGDLIYSIINATSFTINSVQRADPSMVETNDDSTFSYVIIRQF